VLAEKVFLLSSRTWYRIQIVVKFE